MTLTYYGIREWGLGLLVSLVLIAGFATLMWYFKTPWVYWTGGVLIGVVLLIFLALAAFFRNPARRIPPEPESIASPADGEVRDIVEVDDFKLAPFTGPARRIGIFLSVLDVHVNRAPADFSVSDKSYREGVYVDARHPDCARLNEAMTLSGTASAGGRSFPMAVRQISGAIARRIVCPVDPGRKLRKGEVYGMIKFGSRTELYLPLDGVETTVRVGDRVRGGETVIAKVIK